MILVNNFKTVLLVGLICTVGFSPSFGEDDNAPAGDEATTMAGGGGGETVTGGGAYPKCKFGEGLKMCNADNPYCMIVPVDLRKGCVPADKCTGIIPTGKEMVCDKEIGCCCSGDDCDDVDVEDIRVKVCGTIPCPVVKCKTPMADEGGKEIKCEKGERGCDKSGCIQTCDSGKVAAMEGNMVNCTVPGGCCCEAKADAFCDYGGSIGLLGSFSLVSVAAAAVYFIPFKSS